MLIEGKRVAYITLGCKLNFSDTSTIKHSLEQVGTLTVGEKEGADFNSGKAGTFRKGSQHTICI